MKLDPGNGESLRSICGSLLSFILIAVVLLFSYLKADVLWNKKDVDVLSTVNDNYFTPDTPGYIIDYKTNGFNIAAAFTAYDSETEEILDPTYGELVFKHYYWGVQEDGNYKAGRKKIASMHKCTPKELGLGDDIKESKFMPTNESNRALVNTYQKKMQCIGEEDLEIFGDF